MIITLSIFYYLFLIVVFIFALYTIFNFYHLLRFGFYSVTNIAVMIAYLAISGLLLYLAFSLLMMFDWNQPLFTIDLGFFSAIFKYL